MPWELHGVYREFPGSISCCLREAADVSTGGGTQNDILVVKKEDTVMQKSIITPRFFSLILLSLFLFSVVMLPRSAAAGKTEAEGTAAEAAEAVAATAEGTEAEAAATEDTEVETAASEAAADEDTTAEGTAEEGTVAEATAAEGTEAEGTAEEGTAAEVTAAETTLAETTASEAAADENAADENASDENASDESIAEWTVMLYLCGTDLETEAGMASNNLKGIASTSPVPEVNLIVETGGTKAWHAEELGMDIDPSKLERWSYTDQGFEKVGEAELTSMGAQGTLQDFLTWTMDNFPAKKYQLILWDHGGASLYGVVFDELFNDSSLQLFDIAGALEASGMHLETFMTDSCLMATLETAEAVAPYADYFVGCEESLPGSGTNYASYVQFLYDYPECDGAMLGKRICSSTQEMYSDLNSVTDLGFLTISLIDLSKVAAVREAFDDFIAEAEQMLDDPADFYDYCYATRNRESYANKEYVDIFDLAQRASGHGISPKTAAMLENAVEDAVLFNINGSNHVRSHGMTVFYSFNTDQYKLDHYSRVCKDPVYLAFLDRLSYKWKAPEWVYETVEHKPDVSFQDYSISCDADVSEDGDEVFLELFSEDNFIIQGGWELLQYDPDTDLWVLYGRDPFFMEEDDKIFLRWTSTFDGTWPSLGGVPLTMSISDEQEDYILFTTPMKIGDYKDDIRIQYRTDTEEDEDSYYELLGSSPLDDHTGFPDRNVAPLPSGIEVEPLSTLLNTEDNHSLNFKAAEPFVYYPDMEITREKLPVGEYVVRFVVTDIFGNETFGNMINCYWDGNEVAYEQSEVYE